MADEGGDWFAAADDEGPPPKPSLKKKKEKKEAEPPPEEETVADDEPPLEGEEDFLDDLEPIDPDKLLLFKHWIRPRFLQYTYLYDYRRNYYSDVIDYLDKRQKGLTTDVPRAQTWAERALRTYNSKIIKNAYYSTQKEDTKLCQKIKLGCSFHIFHSKQYFNRRYSTLL